MGWVCVCVHIYACDDDDDDEQQQNWNSNAVVMTTIGSKFQQYKSNKMAP